MRSNANFKSHPIHPMLIVFPIAFFIGTFIFDILGIIYDNVDLYVIAKYMQICGIIGGLLAAIPGAVDYFKTVPPNSSGKKRATQHALLNITNLVLFFIAWLLKGNNINPYVILILETAGIVLLSIAGYLGGTLVYRNQIGVDHRYANAGKWQEDTRWDAEGRALTSASAGLDVDQMKLVHGDDARIVVARTEAG